MIYYWILGSIPFVLLFSLAYYKQDLLLYCNYIPKGQARTLLYLPSRFNLPFEDIYLPTLDGKAKIHCWFIRYQPVMNSTLIYSPNVESTLENNGGIFSFNNNTNKDTISYHSISPVSPTNKPTSIGSTGVLSKEESLKKKTLKKQFQYTPTLIYFHGNAGNISHRLSNVKDIYHICKCHILMVEYRGYGKSTGTPSEEGLKDDAETVIRYLLEKRSDINPNNLFLFGRSLGGAVALDLSSKYSNVIRGTIVENTFTSVNDLIPKLFPYPIVRNILQFFNWNVWNNENVLRFSKFRNDYHRKRLGGDLPILFISGRKDELVPCEHMDKLIEIYSSRFNDYCFVKYFPEGDHNATWMCSGYYQNLYKFIKKFKVNPKETHHHTNVTSSSSSAIQQTTSTTTKRKGTYMFR
ncbi:hypothetical protein ABK040_010873 [Willaertia magna]